MAAPRNNLRSKALNTWGNPHVTMPLADAAAPGIEFGKTIAEGQFPQIIGINSGSPVPAFGSLHPDTTNYPLAYVVGIDPEPGENSTQNLMLTYETLPGTIITSTRLDPDGVPVIVAKQRNLNSAITTSEAATSSLWTKKTKEGDNAVAGTQVTETRALPGNAMVSTRIDDDGAVVAISRTMVLLSTITSGESITSAGATWTKVTAEPISELVGWRVVEVRPIPGNDVLSTQIDDDGQVLFIHKALYQTSLITSEEIIIGGAWVRVTQEDKEGSSLVSWQITTARVIPGNPIYTEQLAEDSAVVTTVKTKKDISTITPGESASGGFLVKTTQEQMSPVSDLVAWEVVETRVLPGNILTDYDQEDETQGLIVTTFQIVANPVSAPSATPGTIVKVKHIDDYNSWLITQSRSTPSGWTYQENGAYHFPMLFDYLSYTYTDACGAFSDSRGAFSVNVQMLIDVTFSTNVQEFTGLQLIPKSLMLGKYVQFSDILTDAGAFVYSGSCTGTVSFGASSPSYSTYLGTIQGTTQIIGGSSKKTRWGDFRNEKIKVLFL